VQSDSDCEERGPSAFPVHEVHKIAQLDMRLANTDRNGGNILARRDGATGEWTLIPIDHGMCLPSTLQDVSFEWLYWPQAKVQFDDASLEYIKGLDADKDVSMLASHGLVVRPECVRVLRVCTMLLKKGAERGLTPFAIGSIMCREANTKSPLEKLHSRASKLAGCASPLRPVDFCIPEAVPAEDAVYMRHMATLMDELLDEVLLDQLDTTVAP
jgi:hypothetical protein